MAPAAIRFLLVPRLAGGRFVPLPVPEPWELGNYALPGPYHSCPLGRLGSLPGASLRGLAFDGTNATLWSAWSRCSDPSLPPNECSPFPSVLEHSLSGDVIQGFVISGLEESAEVAGRRGHMPVATRAGPSPADPLDAVGGALSFVYIHGLPVWLVSVRR